MVRIRGELSVGLVSELHLDGAWLFKPRVERSEIVELRMNFGT